MARLDPATLGPGAKNILALLDTIAHAEGTTKYGEDDGYNVLVGGGLFADYSKHPRQLVWLPRYNIHSTAAGRYQFLWRTWNVLQQRMSLPDFGPESQDKAAIALIRDARAYNDASRGRIPEAIRKIAKIWASMPGAGYGQRELTMNSLCNVYESCGGRLAY